jgi:AraC family transcriptional regulator, transcriptional activator of the genes for pyochelin and ferripyochelin receptors
MPSSVNALQTPPSNQPWRESLADASGSVETLVLREGFSVVLSNLNNAPAAQFVHTETSDVIGLGFHLRGGSEFRIEHETLVTQPLDVLVGTAPRGTISSFVLGATGFRTVALRFAPRTLQSLLGDDTDQPHALASLARAGVDATSLMRLGPLDSASAQVAALMLRTPYSGAARRLYLESCALQLLARQTTASTTPSARSVARASRDRRRAYDALGYLDANLDDPPGLAELARIVGTNDCKLKRDFKALFGTTVFGYVRARRLERAAAELRQGRSVTETALNAGYASPRCFAHAFRRQFGLLPSHLAYRAA